MKNILLLLFATIVVCSCTHQQPYQTPFSHDRLIDLILDIHIVESTVQKYDKNKRDSVQKKLRMRIVKMYNLESIKKLDSLLFSVQNNPIYFHKLEEKVSARIDSIERHIELQK